MIVLDASAVIELVLATRAGEAVARRIRSGEESLHAPHLLDVEVAQVMRRLAKDGIVEAERARGALDRLPQLAIHRYAHEYLLPRVWELRRNLTAYDAVYVALAEALDAPLLTLDRRLGRSSGHGARVEVP